MKKKIDRPVCPYCNKICSPCGGCLDGSEFYWTCWDCGYELNDIEHSICENLIEE